MTPVVRTLPHDLYIMVAGGLNTVGFMLRRCLNELGVDPGPVWDL